jgi:hypothetical protein
MFLAISRCGISKVANALLERNVSVAAVEIV